MKKKRIMVVDDDINATRILKVGLERTGLYQVREVNNGSEALGVAREYQPDAILLDVCMPDAEGSYVAFQIRNDEEFKKTPITFLTCIVTERELAEKGSIIGGYRYIAKPTRLEKVIACLEKDLERAQVAA